MKKKILLLLYLSPLVAFSQDLIKTKEGVDIPCRLQSTSAQIIKYINSNNLQSDSIITENVTELIYKDTLRVFVYPSADREKMELLDEANYKVLFGTKDYAKILHSKTILNDVAFIGTTNNLTLDSKKKLAISLATYKAEKGIYWEITAHTDTIGKASVNLIKSDEKATVFKNYLEVQGFDITHLSAIGKGETEPAFFKAGETIKNKRIEIRATKIDKVSILYWETYVPPKVIIKDPISQYPVTSETKPVETNANGQVILQTTRISKRNKSGSESTYKFSFLLGFNGIYNLNNTWKSDKKGIGLDKTGAVNAEMAFRGEKIGISLKAGYSSWLLTRNFIYDEEKLYGANEKLITIPLALGLKVYFNKNVYLMPNAGIGFFNFKSNTDELHPYPLLNQSDKSNAISAGLNAGFEIRFSKILADISLNYQFYNIKTSPSSINSLLNEPISLIGFNVGIGICK